MDSFFFIIFFCKAGGNVFCLPVNKLFFFGGLPLVEPYVPLPIGIMLSSSLICFFLDLFFSHAFCYLPHDRSIPIRIFLSQIHLSSIFTSATSSSPQLLRVLQLAYSTASLDVMPRRHEFPPARFLILNNLKIPTVVKENCPKINDVSNKMELFTDNMSYWF